MYIYTFIISVSICVCVAGSTCVVHSTMALLFFFVNSLSDRSCFHYNISVYLVNPIIHSKPVSELLNCTPRRNNVCEQEETSLMLKPCTHGTSFGIFKFPCLDFLSLNVLYLHFHQCFINCRFPRIRKTL